MDRIYKATLKFLVPLNPEETYKVIVEEAMKLVGAKYGSIFSLVDGEIKRVYSSSPDLYIVEPRKNGYTAKILKSKRYFVRRANISEKIHPEFLKLGIGTDISLALTSHGITLGVLSVLSPKNKLFTDEHLKLLKAFTPAAALALRKSVLHRDLEKAVRARDLFLSVASHELKTPMTTIYGYSQLIEKKVQKGEVPKAVYVERLIAAEKRLMKLINELVQVHTIKLKNTKFEMKKVSITDIIRRAIEEFKFSYPNQKINFSKNISSKQGIVMADEDKIIQVVLNLLNNATKFSKNNTEIRVAINAEESNIAVSVIDKGVGIPAEEQPFIFRRFYKSTVGPKTTSGMGLGLYLVKYIVRAHGGDINLQSKVNQGTNMTFILPKYKGIND